MRVWRIFTGSLLLVLLGMSRGNAQFVRVEPLKNDYPDGQNAPYAVQEQQVKDTSEGYLVVNHILVSGNKRTKTAIILRDLDLHPGDTLSLKHVRATLEERRQQLLNTSLFLSVNVFLKNQEGREADVAVEVIERWYIFPFPIFSLADRNFNVWWVEEKHSLQRVNYGVNIYHNNLTGNNDQLIFTFQNGYTRRYALTYNLPYFDKKLTQGLGFTIGYSQNHEVNYITDTNKLAFFKQEYFLKKVFSASVSYTYKKAIRFKHQVSLGYDFETVADTVLKLNPGFFPDNNTSQRYFELFYRFTYTGADSWAYPLHGFNISASADRKGFGILGKVNQTTFAFNAAQYWQLFDKTYAAAGLRGQLVVPFNQPYFIVRGMGYEEDYLRGLEYFVMNSDAFGILKTDLKREILAFKIRTYLLPRQFATIPIHVYLKAYGDLGYARGGYPDGSSLNNRLLYTGGVGLDIVSFYDIRLRIEYSFNQLGRNGLFLHTKSEF